MFSLARIETSAGAEIGKLVLGDGAWPLAAATDLRAAESSDELGPRNRVN